MEDIRIVINRSSRLIKSISKRILGNDGENLQENLVFSFEDEFVNGQARLEYQLPDDTTGWLALSEGEETYQIPVRNVLMFEGTIYFQLVVTEGTDETSIPLFKSNIFKMKINESLNTVEIEAPDGYASWLDLANTKLNQMDNFDINVSKVGDTATIEVTNRLGETSSASIKDGEIGPTGPQGIQGVPGYTPVKGVDYYTESEKQEMINYIINDSESEFNQNAAQKTTEFNNNADSKTLGFNQNATNKTNDFNTNATNKTTTFDNNASAKTTSFNENATSKTTDFNSNASTKTTDFDSHVNSKTTDFDTHASAKLTEYNSNHTSKLQEYNDNAQDKIDDYDEHVQELNDEIEYLQDQVADLSDNQLIAEEEGTEIYVTDSARARLNDFRFTKESSQVTTTGKSLYGGFTFNKINSGITFNYNEDGTIDANGTATNTARSMLSSEASQYLKKLNAGTYIISGGTGDANIEVCNLNSTIATDTGNGAQFTLNEESDVFIRLKVASGKVLNNAKIYSMLSVSGGDYEPYTGGEASPSPDYPQEVEVVEGYENLFDKDNANIISGFITGSDTIGGYPNNKIIYIPITGGKTYTIEKIYGIANLTIGYTTTTPEIGGSVIGRAEINAKICTTTAPVSANYLCVVVFRDADYNAQLVLQDILDKVIITEGTSEHPYVPYGNNYVDVKVTGKNKFNIYNFEATKNGLTIVSSKQEITITGTNTHTSSGYSLYSIQSDLPVLEIGKTYTISLTEPLYNGYLQINYWKEGASSESSLAILYVNGKKTTFTIPNDFNRISQIFFGVNSTATTINTKFKIQIEEGSTATSYEPYQESIVPIALNGNFIGGISDYKDTLIVDKFGKCYLSKIISKNVFDGSEVWQVHGSIPSWFYYDGISNAFISNSLSNYAKSNYFRQRLYNEVTSLVNGEFAFGRPNQPGIAVKRIVFKNTDYTTVNDFKTWLQDKYNNGEPVYLVYPLEQEELIDLNYTIDLKTFKGVSNITNSENANMKIRYVRDINEVINNITNSILEIGGE